MNTYNPKLKKIPLTIECIHQTYDVTEMQPQLFVTPNFQTLIDVLNQLSETMSYKVGGKFGVDNAIKAKTVNTVEFDSGLQVSGKLVACELFNNEVAYLNFSGPTQLSVNSTQIDGHGVDYHKEGFGCPVGLLNNQQDPIYKFNQAKLRSLNLEVGSTTEILFASGVKVAGRVSDIVYNNDNILLISFQNCSVTIADKLLFDPSWGTYDMATGTSITSVFGNPADRDKYEAKESFVSKKIPAKTFSSEDINYFNMFKNIFSLSTEELQKLAFLYLSDFQKNGY